MRRHMRMRMHVHMHMHVHMRTCGHAGRMAGGRGEAAAAQAACREAPIAEAAGRATAERT